MDVSIAGIRNTMRRRVTEARADRDERLEALAAVADDFKSFRPAAQVFTRVEAVPTIFCQFDHAVRVSGFPTERFTLTHGPSGHNKTTFSMGLIRSFLARNHYALMIDAERTTPEDYARQLIGDDLYNHPGFFAHKPKSYEDTIERVRSWLLMIANLRAKGRIPKTTRALVVVDSIRKLVPENILKMIMAQQAKAEKEGKKAKKGRGADGMGGRGAQIKAAMNSAWMDELIPLLEEAKGTMNAVARETADPDAEKWQKDAGLDFKVGGGTGLFYDSSLVMRAERAGWITDGSKFEETGQKAKIYGEKIRITIRKTKVAGKDDKQSVCHFHTSNGVLTPAGFDRARDVIELAKQFEIVTGTGWLSWGKKKLGQGMNNAVKRLYAEPDLLAALEREVRADFANHEPVEHDEDGVVG
jgi:recombination protein RecA